MLSGEDPAFWTVMRNTVVFAACYTVLNLVISIGLSYWLQRVPEWLSRVLRVIFFIPVVTPMVGNALIWRLMLSDNGVVNSALAVFGIEHIPFLNQPALAMGSLLMMSLWQGLGYNIVVLTAGVHRPENPGVWGGRLLRRPPPIPADQRRHRREPAHSPGALPHHAGPAAHR